MLNRNFFLKEETREALNHHDDGGQLDIYLWYFGNGFCCIFFHLSVCLVMFLILSGNHRHLHAAIVCAFYIQFRLGKNERTQQYTIFAFIKIHARFAVCSNELVNQFLIPVWPGSGLGLYRQLVILTTLVFFK